MSDVDSDLEIPETDFASGIQPHRYARLQSGYTYTVHLDPETWSHFGSQEAVVSALKALIEASKRIHAA